MSCTPATGNTDVGSSTGTDTTVSTTLKEFMMETFDDFKESDHHKVYSGKIKGTENDYVLIPAKAAVPNNFSKKSNDTYSLGDGAELIKDSAEGMNIYFYHNGDSLFYFNGSHTITMDSTMKRNYFGNGEVSDQIVIGGETFNIVY
ncbi:MAG: hypothetical protein K6A43_08795 [Treponema sp.]|nr:hypothetical protein [Treponema sp.]